MKPFNLYKALLFTIIPFIALPVLAQSGSYTLSSDDLGSVITISVPANVPIKITCSYNQNVYADVWTENDERDGDGPDSWQFTTVTDGNIYIYCGDEGNGGPYNFTLNWVAGSYSAIQDSYIHGNSVVDGNLGIGVLSPREKLEVNGNIRGNQSGGGVRIQTDYGYLVMGPLNEGWAHVLTDMPKFFFNKPIYAQTGEFSSYLGTNLSLQTYGTPRMTILNSNGNVGIGTTTPSTKAQVYGTLTVDATGQSLNNYSEGIRVGAAGNGYSNISFGVNPAVASGVQANQWWIGKDGRDNGFNIYGNSPHDAFHILPSGNVGIGTITPSTKLEVHGNVAIGQYTSGTAVIDAYNSYAYFGCNTATNGIAIGPTGKVSIGTTDADLTAGVLLTVKGTIHAKEVLVDLNAPLADFVFTPTYKLMPLPQVEQFVNANSHLPEIPSAAEVSKNGMSVGEMQNKLLQKVEELTLYMIEQQKTINQQNSKIEELEKKLK